MNPFIYKFLDSVDEHNTDEAMNLIEYSTELNLTIIKGTKHPAVNINALATQTFTKAGHEPSDSDQDWKLIANSNFGTGTQTRQMIEGGDSDYNKSLITLMGTKTVTLSHEGIDSDDNSQFRLIFDNQKQANSNSKRLNA